MGVTDESRSKECPAKENHNSFQERFYQIDMKRHKCSMHHPNIENNLLHILNIEYDSDDDDDDDDDDDLTQKF